MSSPFRFRRDKGSSTNNSSGDASKAETTSKNSVGTSLSRSPKRTRNGIPLHGGKTPSAGGSNGNTTTAAIGLHTKGSSSIASAQSRQPKNYHGHHRIGSIDNNSRSSNSTTSSNGLKGGGPTSGSKTKKVHNSATLGSSSSKQKAKPPRPSEQQLQQQDNKNRSTTPPPSTKLSTAEQLGTPPKYPIAMASSSVSQSAASSIGGSQYQSLVSGLHEAPSPANHALVYNDSLPGSSAAPATSTSVMMMNQHLSRDQQQQHPFSSPKMKAAKISVKKAIEDLNKAIGHDRRIAAITNACEEFDHWEMEKHNLELTLGAANVLSLVLSMTDNDDEIRMICAALEMVYRGSHTVVAKSFQEVGAAVVPLLLRLLERCECGNMRNADVSIMNISKVLLYFSRVPALRLPLVRHQGLLQALTRVATSILNADSRVVRMRVLANLANADVNRTTMFEHTGLVESVVKIASLDLSDSAREYAAAALMDLAGAPSNQNPMAHDEKLLSTLVRLAVTDPKPETREYAVTALQNLAFAKDNRSWLSQFCNGVVLEALKKLLISDDQNDKARRRAAGALTNLACDETAEILGQHEGLLDVLAGVSMSDRNEEVQKRASLALTKIANSITSSMPCHSTLLSSLVKASHGLNGSNIAGVLRAKARIVENRFSMARHPELLDTLAFISMNDNAESTLKDREDAMRAIMHLTNENNNRKLMANKIILDTLVRAAQLRCDEPEHEGIRDSAITAIERLATEVNNRKIMARHDGLLVAVAMAVEREAKYEKLAPESSKVRLAKPLLMSLLVAM